MGREERGDKKKGMSERGGGGGRCDSTREEKTEASMMSWMCLSQAEDSRHDRNPDTV